jgi:hypothetical protein
LTLTGGLENPSAKPNFTSSSANWFLQKENPPMMFLTSLICAITLFWMCAKVWKDSVLFAIGCFLFWPALILALFKYWGDEESDIKTPFFVFLPCALYTLYAMSQFGKDIEPVREGMLLLLPMLG